MRGVRAASTARGPWGRRVGGSLLSIGRLAEVSGANRPQSGPKSRVVARRHHRCVERQGALGHWRYTALGIEAAALSALFKLHRSSKDTHPCMAFSLREGHNLVGFWRGSVQHAQRDASELIVGGPGAPGLLSMGQIYSLGSEARPAGRSRGAAKDASVPLDVRTS